MSSGKNFQPINESIQNQQITQTSENDGLKLEQPKHSLSKQDKKGFVFQPYMALVLLVACLFLWKLSNVVPPQQIIRHGDCFPRILWIYTGNQRDSQDIKDEIFLTYYEQFAKQAKYEVRRVTSLTAYDYISSNETIKNITNAMNKRTVDQTVHDFLKLALLIEHGGIVLQPGTVFLKNNFDWIENLFYQDPNNTGSYICKPSQCNLYIPKHDDQYHAKIIAALPGSPLLNQLLLFLTQVVTSEQLKTHGVLPAKYNIKGLQWNQDLGVFSFTHTLNNCLNHLLKMKDPKNQKCFAGIQQPTQVMTLIVPPGSKPTPMQLAFEWHTHSHFLADKGLNELTQLRAITGLNTQQVMDRVMDLANGDYNRRKIANTLMQKVLEVPGNRQIVLQDLPQRNIELCLVLMEGLTYQQLIYTSKLFNNQTFNNWRLIMPAKNLKNAPRFDDKRIALIHDKENKVHNIEKAVTQFCPLRGYAVLFNYGQTFANPKALQSIAKAAQSREIAGIYIPLQHNNLNYKVHEPFLNFKRNRDGIVNPKINQMRHMLNHFRVFYIQTFRSIPQYYLRNWNGEYFKDRIIFLMDFHDFISNKVMHPFHYYMIKKNANIWTIPTTIIKLDQVALLKINLFQELDREQIVRTRTRISSCYFIEVLNTLQYYKVPVSKMVAYNEGADRVPADQKEGPELIPRVIHQVWLGSEIPPAKKYFIEKTKKIYPSYQVKVWRNQNITKQLFPNTYDLIQNLIDFDKRSPYNKLATVTDIMRHQILYQQGGLWKDAGMNMLRPIPLSFHKYKLILPTDLLFRYRYLQGMCVFGNMPKFENLLRINNFRNLNKMRIHSKEAFGVAGPVDFNQILIGQDESDPQIMLLPYQTFYPGQLGQHPEGDLCSTNKLKENESYEVEEGGYYLLSDCDKKYPYAFGIQHNNYGNSWVYRRNLTKPAS